MKIYEVEMCRRSYVIVTVEAESIEDAKDKAWEEVTSDGSWGTNNDASWDIEYAEEVREETA
jgi:hypothetical protein